MLRQAGKKQTQISKLQTVRMENKGFVFEF